MTTREDLARIIDPFCFTGTIARRQSLEKADRIIAEYIQPRKDALAIVEAKAEAHLNAFADAKGELATAEARIVSLEEEIRRSATAEAEALHSLAWETIEDAGPRPPNHYQNLSIARDWLADHMPDAPSSLPSKEARQMGDRKLTRAQKRALVMARDHGHALANVGIATCAGGAYRRMCERLGAEGLLTRRAPFEITESGRSALKGEKEGG